VDSVAPYALSPADRELVGALRAGDESAFGSLVDRYYAPMLSVARSYVASREAAEDVVQETWMGVIEGIDRFEGRCSLKTWMYRILVNRARTRGERESRTRPFSSLTPVEEPVVDPGRFRPDSHRWGGFWADPPTAELPEQQALATEMRGMLKDVIAELPDAQRIVISLRDVQDFTAEEVCELLDISEGNQRVLLHRARSKARAALEMHLKAGLDA
jgi:RNA polymerase sigma-70 factor (ECF subfamily)